MRHPISATAASGLRLCPSVAAQDSKDLLRKRVQDCAPSSCGQYVSWQRCVAPNVSKVERSKDSVHRTVSRFDHRDAAQSVEASDGRWNDYRRRELPGSANIQATDRGHLEFRR